MAARAQGPPRYKAILVGDVGVGKTSIWRALHTDPPLSFLADTSKLPQIDLDTYSYQVQTDSGQTIVVSHPAMNRAEPMHNEVLGDTVPCLILEHINVETHFL